MSKETKLKPCPFCEGKAQIFSIPRAEAPFNGKKDKWYIQCKKCSCGMSRTRKYNLIKAWNRRPKSVQRQSPCEAEHSARHHIYNLLNKLTDNKYGPFAPPDKLYKKPEWFDALEKESLALRQSSPWIKITDETPSALPKYTEGLSERALLTNGETCWVTRYVHSAEQWAIYNDDKEPTHYMPLPALPDGGEE